MKYNKITDELYKAAVNLIDSRFPDKDWEGAAAIQTSTGKIITSTAPECNNDGVSLCHETGAYCEAYKINEDITASICVSKDDKGKYHILTPCGICQERLYYYGGDVAVAVPHEEDSTKWISKLLKEIQPYYWRKPFDKDE